MAEAKLGEPFEAWMAGLVESGRFASRGDVLREGVRLVQAREAAAEAERDQLRALILEGDESGDAEPFDLDSILKETRDERRRSRG